MRSALLGLCCVLWGANASAAAFILNDHGARATGRGVAVTATVDDGSAIFYNPAGIGFIDGVNVYAGGALIAPREEFRDDATGTISETDTGVTITPNVYIAGEITDWLRVGIGFNTPFGSRVSWPADQPVREVLREQVLRTYFFSPVLALNLSRVVEGLSIGGGPDFVPATVEQTRDVLFGSEAGQARLGGSALGFGGRVGLMYRPPALRDVSFGLSWRSGVRLNFSGEADFDASAPFGPLLPADGPIRTAISLPQAVLAGVAYRPLRNLELEVNVNWIGWSGFDELAIQLPDGSISVQPRNYSDTVVLRVGGEYAIPAAGVAVRAGYAYDPTPIPSTTLDATLPDINRHVVTLGATYNLPFQIDTASFYVDLGVLYVIPRNNQAATGGPVPTTQGTFNVSALLAALSVGVNFDIPAVGGRPPARTAGLNP